MAVGAEGKALGGGMSQPHVKVTPVGTRGEQRSTWEGVPVLSWPLEPAVAPALRAPHPCCGIWPSRAAAQEAPGEEGWVPLQLPVPARVTSLAAVLLCVLSATPRLLPEHLTVP